MATMSQEEVDAWLGAHGGGQLQHGIEKKQVRNPNYNEVKGPTPSNPEFITIDVETWTNSKTGAKLVAQHLPDGSWERHDAVEGDPNKPGADTKKTPPGGKPYIDDGPEAGKTGRRWGWNPDTGAYDRDLGSSPAAQAAEQGQSGEERGQVPNRPGWTFVTRTQTQNGNTTKVTKYIGPDGKEVDTLPAETKTTREPDPKHPGLYVVSVANPATGATDTHYENAAGQRVEAPPEKEEILQGRGPNGEDVRVIRDPTTGRVLRYEPIEGGASKNPLIPAGAPRYTPDYTKDDLGLADYNEQLQQAARDGIITRQQGQQLIEQAGGLAQTTATHGSTLRTQAGNLASQAITQRGQDINEVQSRRTAADSMFRDLFARYHDPAHGGMTGEEGLASQAFLAALDLAKGNTQQYGGLTDVPQVPPAYTMALGAPTPTTTISPDGTISVNHAPAAPATPPNAIGAGGIGSVTPPGAPPAAGPKPPPIFTPQPVAPPPTPVNPLPGQPGNDPTKPVGLIPPSTSVMALGGPTTPPAFTPDVAAIKAAIPGISDAELQQALAEHQQEMAGVG